MDFEPSPEQEDLQHAVRHVLVEECPLSLVRAVFEGGGPQEQPWKSATQLGWTGIAVPERFGGLGLGFEELGLVVEEHGRALAPGPFLATVTQFAPALREAASPAQAERWLGALARGELSGALAVAGASDSGWHPDASLVARRAGAGWRLQGERAFVLGGDVADEVVAAARVEEGDGVALFAVPGSDLACQPIVSLDASRPLARLVFDGVEVGAERVLGEPGRCAPALGRALEEAAVALALETVGACSALLERCVEYARHRIQFGQPIGAFQAIQHKLADVLVALEKARATAYFAMMVIAEDDPRRSLAASMAKASAGDCQRLLCKEAIQIHGGTGFTWESDVHLFVKRAKTGEALLGTAREHRARIADLLLADAG